MTTTPTFTFSRPTELPIVNTIHPLSQRNYDVTPDGRQLLVVLPAKDESSRPMRPQIDIVINWFEPEGASTTEMSRVAPFGPLFESLMTVL